jgi:hypothetical protein
MNRTHVEREKATAGAGVASPLKEAKIAVARLVEKLQAGWGQHDATVSNRHFAADVMWGSPFW